MGMEIVNGYVCRNCTDVEYAKKGVDPAHPKDGPQGAYANAKTDEAKAKGAGAKDGRAEFGSAVTLGGQLRPDGATPAQTAQSTPYTPGSTVNVSA